MSVFSKRLKSAMKKSKITQAELSLSTGIPKSAISQYLSDKFKPRQERIYILSRALGVSPAWLSGYDNADTAHTRTETFTLTDREYQIIEAYRTSVDFRAKIDAELLSGNMPEILTFGVFRAAKSKGGKIAPTKEEVTAQRLIRLAKAPETDEDI